MARTSLVVLDAEVGRRVEQMQRSHGPWPCAAGCDRCCRRLGKLLQITQPEFERLWSAIVALDDHAEVTQRVLGARPNAAGHWTCPLLDEDAGKCRVYEARPTPCRSYGFYSGRDGDYWCETVTEHLGSRRDDLIAGNQVALDRRRDRELGPSRDLAAWVRTKLAQSR